MEVFGDVIGGDGEGEDATFGVAFFHDFEEGLVDEVHFFLEFTVGFFLGLAADDDGLVGVVGGGVKIEGEVGEGGLEADAGGDVDVEDEFLDGLFDLGVGELVVVNVGGEEGVERGEGLGTGCFALEGIEEVGDLAEGGAEVLGWFAFGFAGDAAEALDEEVVEIPTDTVDGDGVEIVNVKVAIFVCLADFGRIDFVEPVYFADFGGDVVVEALKGEGHVGVFVDFPIEFVDIGVDEV